MGGLVARESAMWANLKDEVREAARLALIVLSLSVLSVATAIALVSFV